MISAGPDQVHLGDCLELLPNLPDGVAQLVIADPPSNLGKRFGSWREPRDLSVWLPWCRRWLSECARVLAENGSIFVYGIHHYLCYLQCELYGLGLIYRRQIIWHYENGFAGYSRTLAAHYEPLLWFSKGPTYTYHAIREPYKSTERLRHPITKRGRVWRPNPGGRLAGDVWHIPTLAGRRFSAEKVDHPTQKPIALANRIIEHFSNEGDLVVVPFAGSGTECASAVMLGRHFWAAEINTDYVRIATLRVQDARDKEGQSLWSPTPPDRLPSISGEIAGAQSALECNVGSRDDD